LRFFSSQLSYFRVVQRDARARLSRQGENSWALPVEVIIGYIRESKSLLDGILKPLSLGKGPPSRLARYIVFGF
jgi:hypothetical protein